MGDLRQRLARDPAFLADPLGPALLPVLARPASLSSSGFPYLEKAAWDALRDRLPHLFGMGLRLLRLIGAAEGLVAADPAAGEEGENLRRSCRVVRQVVLTAAITAPPDLWLLRHLLGTFHELGLLERLVAGEALYPGHCREGLEGGSRLHPEELEKDLLFLLSRGIVEQYEDSFRIAGHPRVRQLLGAIDSSAPVWPEGRSGLWRKLFAGEVLDGPALEGLLDLTSSIRPRRDPSQNHWVPTLEEVEIGFRLVPLVLGLRAADLCAPLRRGREVAPMDWSQRHPLCAAGALEILTAAGWMERRGEGYRVTALGDRGFARGPGPFGIIETYHPYLIRGREILLQGAAQVWVRRGENLGASQDANRGTFLRANDSLDRFCSDTGFRYTVFIEHAIGRGEATRQRFERSGEAAVRYFGADLEDAAIDAALEEQRRGALPQNMVFVRNADIGRPKILIEALEARGEDPEGAVMLVGNGFHEVRRQTDEDMVRVFKGYQDAGIILLFTEENALSVDDLRATAWNTFHAGFKYVHEKSGQGLRPADSRPPARLGWPLRAPWSQCAQEAGYVRLDEYCSRTRSIYPYPPASGINPSISTNHFFLPRRLTDRLAAAASGEGGPETPRTAPP